MGKCSFSFGLVSKTGPNAHDIYIKGLGIKKKKILQSAITAQPFLPKLYENKLQLLFLRFKPALGLAASPSCPVILKKLNNLGLSRLGKKRWCVLGRL